jgi:hypothetical protein
MLNSSITSSFATTGLTRANAQQLNLSPPKGDADDASINASLGGMAAVANAVNDAGAPKSASDATAVLNTGADYIRNGQRTVDKLTTSIERRSAKIEEMKKGGASAGSIAREQEQLDLAQRLLERIDQSVHRIEDILVARAKRQGEAAAEATRLEREKQARQAAQDRTMIESAHNDLSVQVARRYGMS